MEEEEKEEKEEAKIGKETRKVESEGLRRG